MCKLGEVFLAAAGAFFPQKLRSWDSMTCNLHVFKCIYIDFYRFALFFYGFTLFLYGFHRFLWIYMDLHGFGCHFSDSTAWAPVGDGFSWFFMDLHGISRILEDFSDSGAWRSGCPVAPCGGLWRAVATCGRKLWPL